MKIEKLPAGTKLTFKLYHESQKKALDKIELNGKPAEWAKGFGELELKPGKNEYKIVLAQPSSSRDSDWTVDATVCLIPRL